VLSVFRTVKLRVAPEPTATPPNSSAEVASTFRMPGVRPGSSGGTANIVRVSVESICPSLTVSRTVTSTDVAAKTCTGFGSVEVAPSPKSQW